MYCYNLYSLLRPVNNLSLRGEGRGKLEDCFGGGTKGDHSSVTEYEGRTYTKLIANEGGHQNTIELGGGGSGRFYRYTTKKSFPLITQGNKLGPVP